MKASLFLAVLLAATGCRPPPSPDRIKFDALLQTGRIDHVQLVGTPLHLNSEIWERNCQHYLTLFVATNRQDAPASTSPTSDSRDYVVFWGGTNALGRLTYDQTRDSLAFGTYCFRLRNITNFYMEFWP